MKMQSILLAVAAMAVALPLAAEVDSLRQAVDAGNAKFLATRISGDAPGFASLFDEDGAFLEPGGTVVRGRAAVEREIAASMKKSRIVDGKITTIDVFPMGDLAYETGTYSFSIAVEGKEPRAVRGKYVEVWKKQADGGWKMFRDIGLPE
jgi:uncharacterized protein (TIGR02246 family)